MASSSVVSPRYRRSRPTADGPSSAPGEVLFFRGAEHLDEGSRALEEARWQDARAGFVAALAGGESAEAAAGLAGEHDDFRAASTRARATAARSWCGPPSPSTRARRGAPRTSRSATSGGSTPASP